MPYVAELINNIRVRIYEMAHLGAPQPRQGLVQTVQRLHQAAVEVIDHGIEVPEVLARVQQRSNRAEASSKSCR